MLGNVDVSVILKKVKMNFNAWDNKNVIVVDEKEDES